LYRGRRFAYEFALLSLPLLRAHPVVANPGGVRIFASRAAAWTLAFVLLLMPVAFIVSYARSSGTYPFSVTGLPEGVCTFLDRHGTGGKLLNPPNSGGYLRWRLYPKYTILMDMDSYFTDDDYYMSRRMLNQPHILQELLDRYDPTYITAPLLIASFRDMLATPQFQDYRPVFFDDSEVLYANRRHVPELVERFELRTLAPWKTFTRSVLDLAGDTGSRAEVLKEAERMLEVYPIGGNLNQLVGLIRMDQGRHDLALAHARRIVATYPEHSQGYALLGDALDALGDGAGAMAAYRTSVYKAGSDWQQAYRQIGEIYLDRKDFDRAYKYFSKAIDPLREDVEVDALYQLAWAALHSGRVKIAGALLTFIMEFRLPEGDTVWREKIGAMMAYYGLTTE
jgi:tetratricopeptide (TPR) repeat protein